MIRRSCDGGRGYFRASVKLIFYRVCCHFKLRLRPDFLSFFNFFFTISYFRAVVGAGNIVFL